MGTITLFASQTGRETRSIREPFRYCFGRIVANRNREKQPRILHYVQDDGAVGSGICAGFGIAAGSSPIGVSFD